MRNSLDFGVDLDFFSVDYGTLSTFLHHYEIGLCSIPQQLMNGL